MDYPRTDAQDFDLSARTSEDDDALQVTPADLEPVAGAASEAPFQLSSDTPVSPPPAEIEAPPRVQSKPVALAMDAMLFNALMKTTAPAASAPATSAPVQTAASEPTSEPFASDEAPDESPDESLKLFPGTISEAEASDWEPLPLMRIAPAAPETPPTHRESVEEPPINVVDFSPVPLFKPTFPYDAAPASEPAVAPMETASPAAPDPVADEVVSAPEPEPEAPPKGRTGAWWTIPLMCAGLAMVACAILVPAADENRRAMHELVKIDLDVAYFEKQSDVNKQFLEHVSTDPALAERLAMRQLRLMRPDARLVQMPRKDDPFSMSPYALVSVDPPAAVPAYRPLGGFLTKYFLDTRGQIYFAGLGALLTAAGVILGGGAPAHHAGDNDRMSHTPRLILWGVIFALAATVVTGIDWGLPSRRADRFLFASHSAWTGAEIAAFDSDRRDAQLGADVDRNPDASTTQPVVVNSLDANRAEIIRRYRLFSAQPDEMITFMALQQMRPGQRDFDPRLYQYGGLWLYPVGALLKGAAMISAVDLRADKAFYYDKPQEFGRFYVVARLYTLAWYVVLLALVAKLTHRLTGSDVAAIASTIAVGVLPVVFAMAHEAKPHLPGAALMLLACLAAMRWIEKGRNRDAILAGITCGLASGMVLSAAVIGIVLPVMILLRKATFGQRLGALGLAITWMAFTYAITNPYVPINLLRDSAALKSNFANTQAMYRAGQFIQGMSDGSMRLLEAGTPVLTGLGVVAIVAAIVRRKVSPLAWLIAVPSAIVLVQFLLLAAGKPSEYGRFALFPTIALSIGAIGGLNLLPWRWGRWSLQIAAPAVVLAIWTWPYVTAFIDDATSDGTRLRVAERLRNYPRDARVLQVFADPAPYTLPPLDVWRWEITRTPASHEAIGDVIIRPIDDPSRLRLAPEGYAREVISAHDGAAPITWADKPFEILIRQ